MADSIVSIRGRRAVLHPERAPSSFNRVLWTRVGPEAILEFGYYDLNDLRILVERAKESPATESELTVYITERYIMTPQSLLELVRQSCSLAKDLVKEGMLNDKDFKDAKEGSE